MEGRQHTKEPIDQPVKMSVVKPDTSSDSTVNRQVRPVVRPQHLELCGPKSFGNQQQLYRLQAANGEKDHIVIKEKNTLFGVDFPTNFNHQSDDVDGNLKPRDHNNIMRRSFADSMSDVTETGDNRGNNQEMSVFTTSSPINIGGQEMAFLYSRSAENMPSSYELMPVTDPMSLARLSDFYEDDDDYYTQLTLRSRYRRASDNITFRSHPNSTVSRRVTHPIVSSPLGYPGSFQPMMTLDERMDSNDMEDTNSSHYGSGGRNVSMMRHSSQTARPRIMIKLSRAKSVEHIMNKENDPTADDMSVKSESSDSLEESVGSSNSIELSSDQNIPDTSASTPSSFGDRRNSYFERVRSVFRGKSKSLSNIHAISNEELSSRSKGKLSKKAASRTSVTSLNDTSQQRFSEVVTKSERKRIRKLGVTETLTKGNIKRLQALENTGRETERKTGAEKETASANEKRTSRVSFVDETEIKQVVRQQDDSTLADKSSEDTPQRSDASPNSDTSHDDQNRSIVKFTRMPNLRQPEVYVTQLHRFTTVIQFDDDEEPQMIKEATHVLPLDGGDAMVTDMLSNKLVLFNSHGAPQVTFAVDRGSEPWATCMTPDGSMAVTLKRQGCVSLWSTSGEPIIEFGENHLSAPTGIQCDKRGRFLVADEVANDVFLFSKTGEFITRLEAPANEITNISPNATYFKQPRYICITNAGNYVIADSANHCIKVFDPNLNLLNKFGSYGRCDGQFKFPYGIACDSDDNLYVADHYNNRVCLFSSDGQFLSHILTSNDGITRPKCVSVKNSMLYVTHGTLRSNIITVYRLSKPSTVHDETD